MKKYFEAWKFKHPKPSRVIIGSRYANGPQNQNDRGHARVFEYVNSAWIQMGAWHSLTSDCEWNYLKKKAITILIF